MGFLSSDNGSAVDVLLTFRRNNGSPLCRNADHIYNTISSENKIHNIQFRLDSSKCIRKKLHHSVRMACVCEGQQKSHILLPYKMLATCTSRSISSCSAIRKTRFLASALFVLYTKYCAIHHALSPSRRSTLSTTTITARHPPRNQYA
jgi:hypothetical protein